MRAELLAHLEEVLAPTADDDHAAAAVTKLGSPRDIVAEALGTNRPRPWLRRVRRRTWLWAALVVVVVGTGVAALVIALLPAQMPSPVDVDGFGVASFGRRRDQPRESGRRGERAQHQPRSWQRQGFLLEFYNGTSVTQTLIGLRPGAFVFGGQNRDYRLEFAKAGQIPDWDHASYRPGPVDIAPNQSVDARLSWDQRMCPRRPTRLDDGSSRPARPRERNDPHRVDLSVRGSRAARHPSHLLTRSR